MPAPERIKRLIEILEQNINEYRFRKNETELRQQIRSTDRQIDELAYKLYGLSKEK